MAIVKISKKDSRAWLKKATELNEKEIVRTPTLKQLMARIEAVEDLLIHTIANLRNNKII